MDIMAHIAGAVPLLAL